MAEGDSGSTAQISSLSTVSPTGAHLKSVVVRMREKGLKASGCKCRIRAINDFLKWSESTLRIPKLKKGIGPTGEEISRI